MVHRRSRVTMAPVELASRFRWHGTSFTDGQIIDTRTPCTAIARARPSTPQGRTGLGPRDPPGVVRAVSAFSTRRSVRDGTTLTLQENRARAVVAGQKLARTPRSWPAPGDGCVAVRRRHPRLGPCGRRAPSSLPRHASQSTRSAAGHVGRRVGLGESRTRHRRASRCPTGAVRSRRSHGRRRRRGSPDLHVLEDLGSIHR